MTALASFTAPSPDVSDRVVRIGPDHADFVFAAGGLVIQGDRSASIDLPSLAAVGPGELSRRASDAIARQSGNAAGALVCGLVPFDPQTPPDLFVVEHPKRFRLDLPAASDRTAGSVVGGRSGDAPGDRAQAAHESAVHSLTTCRDEAYRSGVAQALTQIDDGALRKVVLARSIDVTLGDLAPGVVWARLAARNPHGYTFAVRRTANAGGPDHFLGASPELVAEVDAAGFATHPLAGSTPRSGEALTDSARGRALLASDKDRREHGFVVDHIVERLRPLLRRLDVPSGPGLFATDAMLHLGTRLTGSLRPGVSSLQAALTIHPTPAVCGVPTLDALEAIRRIEQADRGCYAGLVGWQDADGHGQWALALRCARVRAGHARLFAGAGVVAGSTPDAEHAETAAKFATMTAALTAASTTTGGTR